MGLSGVSFNNKKQLKEHVIDKATLCVFKELNQCRIEKRPCIASYITVSLQAPQLYDIQQISAGARNAVHTCISDFCFQHLYDATTVQSSTEQYWQNAMWPTNCKSCIFLVKGKMCIVFL